MSANNDSNKKKILFISDHPLVPSGVGTQAKYLIEGLLKTNKYKFICLGGAIQHPNYTPQQVAPEKYGDDWVIIPVQGYGDKDSIRKFLYTEKPDAIFIFTDPRFFVWLWEMEDEIKEVCPLVYWHVWDNDPSPRYNKPFYDSTNFISALSLKTYGMLQDIGYERCNYIPHSLPDQLFKPLPDDDIIRYKHDYFGPHKDKKFILFWNNRNARRKQTGDVIATFAKFANIVGKDNVSLMMHTNIDDPEGQNILSVANCYGIDQQLIISEKRLSPEDLNIFYNVIDCTINIASNEGFGLGTLESLYAGTPIIVHMTGGLQFQIGNWWQKSDGSPCVNLKDQDDMTKTAKKLWNASRGDWWGIPVFSSSRSCTGSQQIPYIYDDRVSHDDVVKALIKMYEMGRVKRRELGQRAREWAIKNFNQNDMIKSWDSTLEDQINTYKKTGATGLRLISI